MLVTREECRSAVGSDELSFDESPIQFGMGGDPWRVAVCSALLCRARRAQIRDPLRALLTYWPTPVALATAETDRLEAVLNPCGMHRTRARQLQRFSSLYTGDGWQDLRELPGIGAYISDAVGLFAFKRTQLECNDKALTAYVQRLVCSATS